LSEGLDHRVVPLGKDTVERQARPAAGGLEVRQEASLLCLLRGRVGLPVPRIVAVDPERRALEMERIHGVPLLELLPQLAPDQAQRLGGELGDLIAQLASVPPSQVAELVPHGSPDLEQLLCEAAVAWAQFGGAAPSVCHEQVWRFVSESPGLLAPETAVLTHQDLGAEHVFVSPDDLRITGIIDWSDAALGDPAVDLGLVLRDLGPDAGETATLQFVRHDLECEELLPRAYFHARVRAIEDLAHGVRHGLSAYRDNARRAIAWLFDD